MAGFRRAKPEQASLKIGLYGPAGSGKTMTALLMAEGLAKLSGKRIAFVDTERGTDFYCQKVPSRGVHPDAFEFDAIYSRSITEIVAACRELDPKQYGVLVIDSITHLWEAALAAYGGKLTAVGSIPMHAWGRIKRPYKDLMSILLSTPLHVIICGRQKTVYAEDEETEELKAIGVTMRAEGETPYEPHILIRMEALRPKRTNEVAQIVAYAEKDRTGVLAGRSFVNPTFESLCQPLLGLLGTKQAKMATTAEEAARDAEEIARQDQAAARRSTQLLQEKSAQVTLAKTVKALKAVGATITAQLKAEMSTEDVATLRERYLEREQALGREPQPAEPTAPAPEPQQPAGDQPRTADLAPPPTAHDIVKTAEQAKTHDELDAAEAAASAFSGGEFAAIDVAVRASRKRLGVRP